MKQIVTIYQNIHPQYEYPPSEYPQSDYESNQENDYYNYPPTEDPVSVDIVVPIDFDTIQEAINAANEGDVIKVLPGNYIEQITINKTLTIIGSGAKSTIIEAPAVLNNGVIGVPYIVEINNGAEVTMKGFTIKGPETLSCGNNAFEGLVGVSIQEGATLNLDASVIQGCIFAAVRVGAPPFLPNGPQIGHATIKKKISLIIALLELSLSHLVPH